jgi:hypothetical protein
MSGIFIARLDMGCAAEIMGLAVGDEIQAVNGISVIDQDVECKHLLLVPNVSLMFLLLAPMHSSGHEQCCSCCSCLVSLCVFR